MSPFDTHAAVRTLTAAGDAEGTLPFAGSLTTASLSVPLSVRGIRSPPPRSTYIVFTAGARGSPMIEERF